MSMQAPHWKIVAACALTGPHRLGEDAGTYYFKAHDQLEPKHRGGPRIQPNPLSGHPTGRLSPRRTDVLTQRTHERR